MGLDNYKWNYEASFVNPYNFVSSHFSKKEPGEGLLEEQEDCTGVLKCRLLTKTPIAIPGDVIKEEMISGEPEKKHKTYEFFNYGDGNYVIPGSSLRGAVRSVYEAITDSCYVTAKESELFTRRNANPPYQPGVLIKEDGVWRLYPATRYKFEIKNYNQQRMDSNQNSKCDQITLEELEQRNLCLGDKVSFDKVKEGNSFFAKNIKKLQEDIEAENIGYLYIGEYINNKRYEGVFYIEEKPLNVEESVLCMAKDRLDETVRLYKDPDVNKKMKIEPIPHSGYKYYEKAEKKGVIPLWYQENDTLSLSMACIGRVAYKNTMGNLLKEKKPCKERKNLCKACLLFGMASSKECLGSRVRFSDAVISKEDIKLTKGKLERVMLAELSSPKPSYLPFYLKEPQSKQQTNYGYDGAEVELRGRKFYWHSSEFRKGLEPTERNATVEIIESQEKGFSFRVFYDHISRRQLKELIWTLTLGENDPNSSLCYKIGHGKSIGLGSVKIVIDKQIERGNQDGYSLTPQDVVVEKDIFPNDSSNPIKQQLLKIMDRNSIKDKDVRYPYVQGQKNSRDNARAPHQWFAKNYKIGEKPPEIYLAEILSENEQLSMPSLTYEEDNN